MPVDGFLLVLVRSIVDLSEQVNIVPRRCLSIPGSCSVRLPSQLAVIVGMVAEIGCGEAKHRTTLS